MTEARFIFSIDRLTLGQAQEMAERIDASISFEALAVAINETAERPSLWQVVAYFESIDEAQLAGASLGRADGSINALPDTDWVKQSLQGLAPVAAGRFFLHGSHDRHRRRTGGVSLEIDAGTAFGTGHHGTTEACLIALERIVRKKRPRRILDVGCGTGILAIAAARASGSRALASDIDPEAVRVTRRNARANGVAPRVPAITAAGLKDARIADAAPYDLIFANILARPLVTLAQGLSQILMPGGSLVLSGLTLDQCRWVLAAYRNRGLVPHGKIIRGNWAALVLTRPHIKKAPGPLSRPRRFSARTTGLGCEKA